MSYKATSGFEPLEGLRHARVGHDKRRQVGARVGVRGRRVILLAVFAVVCLAGVAVGLHWAVFPLLALFLMGCAGR